MLTYWKVDEGYYGAWNSIHDDIITELDKLLVTNPTYSIIVTGHSLGGSVGAIGATQLAGIYIDKVTLHTFGEPRSGSQIFPNYVDGLIRPDKLFRATHTNDGVPQILGRVQGYAHHSTEYWGQDPPSAANTMNCGMDNETECNDVAGAGQGVNQASCATWTSDEG
jgi:feruloyl esterase